ncbi:glycosyl transferase family 90-domain-containing protein [Roridomyces roridus]|uniref:Glycosyl transferase family 90-domain-containing protein n=1 Tax=Roridomyces roridus TaxID=1738132 RepID=A0AAD7C3P7_9AGAR|nr:glycosyl transferase family 90-domain-containing protein [Roridomyces roridus]
MASWLHKDQSAEDSHRLLPTTDGPGRLSFDGEEDDVEVQREMSRFATSGPRRRFSRFNWLRCSGGLLVLGFFIGTVSFSRGRGGHPTPDEPKSKPDILHGLSHIEFPPSYNETFLDTVPESTPNPIESTPNPIESTFNLIDALFARQSSTLQQAIARYTVRNNRPPPPNYKEWYEFAKARACLIDDYDQISRDFEPFYQLAREDPMHFKKMVGLGFDKKDWIELKAGVFRDHDFWFTEDHFTFYNEEWTRTFKRFAYFMPDMDVVVNGRDEPRVVFNTRASGAQEKAMDAKDKTPFGHSPHPTASYYKDEMKCLLPNRPKGFTGLANDASAFMLATSSTQFTSDLYPVLSMAKVSPCFADIVVPSEFYYSDSQYSPKYGFSNDIPWVHKKSQLYWRGMTSGGWIYDDNYHSFPRFRLMDIARNHTDIMDVKLSGFHEALCGEHCNATAVKAEYGIYGEHSPREDVYRFKYLFDVDGNSFSGRYHGLLKSGSLVFKSTIFTEYFSDWLKPFEHYIPVLADLSDLPERVEWAIAHDEEAEAIQKAGKEFADRVITDGQNDCYFSLVFLEWARLMSLADVSADD